jgi:chaperonin GroEL (HSP60 family)
MNKQKNLVKINFSEQGGVLFSSIKNSLRTKFNSLKTHFEFMSEKFVMCFVNGPISENLLNSNSFK